MPQDVPEFRFGDDALRLRQFVYERWCAHGRGPNLRAVHAATGMSRERRRSYVNWAGADLMPHRLPTVAGRRAAAAPGGADVRDAVSSNGARPETRTPSRARATTTSSWSATHGRQVGTWPGSNPTSVSPRASNRGCRRGAGTIWAGSTPAQTWPSTIRSSSRESKCGGCL